MLRRFPALNAKRKSVSEYWMPPIRFERLSGDRVGQYSIRINQQWRVCFMWDDGAIEVEIVDYH